MERGGGEERRSSVLECTREAGVVYPRPCLRFKSAARKDGYALARSRNLPTCEYSG